ncbi:MAG: hypothetical protein LBI85_00560, partial [Spirochaetaceae bacterium]|nr:hypothetical protein [Spirochaetaceae bacterium]
MGKHTRRMAALAAVIIMGIYGAGKLAALGQNEGASNAATPDDGELYWKTTEENGIRYVVDGAGNK